MNSVARPLLIVTGAAGGLGRAVVERALFKKMSVIALTRKPCSIHGAEIIVLDLADESGLAPTVSAIGQIIDREGAQRIAFVANAGVLGPAGLSAKNSAESEILEVNCFAQMRIIHMLASGMPNHHFDLWCVSSGMGSIKMVAAGEHYLYAASKASLNIVGRLIEAHFTNVKTVVIDPGWMQTKLGGVDAPLAPTTVAVDLVKKILKGALAQNERHDGLNHVIGGGVSPW